MLQTISLLPHPSLSFSPLYLFRTLAKLGFVVVGSTNVSVLLSSLEFLSTVRIECNASGVNVCLLSKMNTELSTSPVSRTGLLMLPLTLCGIVFWWVKQILFTRETSPRSVFAVNFILYRHFRIQNTFLFTRETSPRSVFAVNFIIIVSSLWYQEYIPVYKRDRSPRSVFAVTFVLCCHLYFE